MEKRIYYKFKKIDNEWACIFSTGEKNIIIKNDIEKLRQFFESNKDTIFIGANNFIKDNILITSLLKNGNLTDEVTREDINIYMPRNLDITQGIVRNNLIDLDHIILSIWTSPNTTIPNKHATSFEEIDEELVFNIEMIKKISGIEERSKFLNWKIDIINHYHLSKEAYSKSFGELLEEIVGLKIKNTKYKKGKKIKLDDKLQEILTDLNDEFLNNILNLITEFYKSEETERPSIKIGDCLVKFNEQGILGSSDKDLIDTTGENTYLYIDFNSFGPNILINNEYLNNSAAHPERLKEVKETRIKLKSEKQQEQLFYKDTLNAGLDSLSGVYTKEKDNVGLSLSITGIMTMMLLYRSIEEYGIKLIECNTDGLIVSCPKENIWKVKEIVSFLEKELSLSCDVDVVKKIVHFDQKNYMMEFENGKIKHLGVFGAFQENPLNYTGIQAVDEAIRNYYFYNIPVSVTLRKLVKENNLKAFQIIKHNTKREKEKYIIKKGKYITSPSPINRLFAVEKEKLKNTLYIQNKSNYEPYSIKKGTKIKEGYYYFELADEQLPSITDLDLTYYIDQCYKIINTHPLQKEVNISLGNHQRNCFIDLDGTLVQDKTEIQEYQNFYEAVIDILNPEDIEKAYYRFSKNPKGSLIMQFLGLCKKYKGFGTIDNLAEFLKSKELFPNTTNIETYKLFISKYLIIEQQNKIKCFTKSKEVLEKLKEEGYNIYLYSNWFREVQLSKLEANNLLEFFNGLCTIDEYYAKSSVKGWNDVLTSTKTTEDSTSIMIGNGSSDIVPKSIGIQVL